MTKAGILLAFAALFMVCFPGTCFTAAVEASRDELPHGGERAAETAGIIEAFVVPHSHMDVGWIYTVQESMVAYAANVYTTVVASLVQNKTRRFIAVEQEFFRLWWTTIATNTQKKQTHQLVQSGQLEFIIGGQVMHDEAVTEYSATIQQMTEGHSFIYETFGKRPHFSWHVDPFGASSATPSLFAMMGFDAHLTSRIDYNVKNQMQKAKSLQFVWRGSPSLGTKQQIFTHVMDQYSYCTPQDLPFSEKSGFYWNGYAVFPKPPADGIYPNMSLPVTDQNIKQYAATMVNSIKQRAAWFQTPQLLWPWGCDKQFFNASIQFENMDKLVSYINKNSKGLGVHVQYATLGEYFDAIHKTNTTWDVRGEQDFLSYSSGSNSVWTGFYTSRANLKGTARRAQSSLHAGETLFSVYLNMPGVNRTVDASQALQSLSSLRLASAEVQHHDGVTGTESPKVEAMYEDHLLTAEKKTLNSMKMMFKDLFKKATTDGTDGENILTSLNNGETLDVGADKPLAPILVYNSLGWSVKRLVQMNITNPNVTVIDIHGRHIGSQVNCPINPGDPYHLFFYAQLTPLNFDVYYIKYATKPDDTIAIMGKVESLPAVRVDVGSMNDKNRTPKEASYKNISNDCFDVTYDMTTQMMHSITDKQACKTIQMQQTFMEYYSFYDVTFGQTSNNYVFRPQGSAYSIGDMVKTDIITGPYVNETRQHIFNMYDLQNSRFTVTLRLFDLPHSHNDDIVCGHIELDFKVGPLTPNKELVYRFSTNIDSSNTLYTNDNGFQTMMRKLRTKVPEPVSQNYYPLVSSAYIESVKQDVRLTVMSKRSHGVASLKNGQMEVMLLRRLVTNSGYDDKNNLTLEKPLVVTPTLWFLLGNRTNSSELQRRAWLHLENPPIIMAVNQTQTAWYKTWKANRAKQVPTIAELQDLWNENIITKPKPTIFTDLPHNVHLLTFKTPGWTYNASHESHLEDIQAKLANGIYDRSSDPPNLKRILIRLQHLYEKAEHPVLSQPVTVDLVKFLSPFNQSIADISERSLSAIWPTKSVKRWTWNTKKSVDTDEATNDFNQDAVAMVPSTENSSYNVTLNAQEIRTFFVTFGKKPN